MAFLGRQLKLKSTLSLIQRTGLGRVQCTRFATSSSDDDQSKGEVFCSGWRSVFVGPIFWLTLIICAKLAGGDSETINFDSKAYRDWVEDALKGTVKAYELCFTPRTSGFFAMHIIIWLTAKSSMQKPRQYLSYASLAQSCDADSHLRCNFSIMQVKTQISRLELSSP